jgi:hypothetical protein
MPSTIAKASKVRVRESGRRLIDARPVARHKQGYLLQLDFVEMAVEEICDKPWEMRNKRN